MTKPPFPEREAFDMLMRMQDELADFIATHMNKTLNEAPVTMPMACVLMAYASVSAAIKLFQKPVTPPA